MKLTVEIDSIMHNTRMPKPSPENGQLATGPFHALETACGQSFMGGNPIPRQGIADLPPAPRVAVGGVVTCMLCIATWTKEN